MNIQRSFVVLGLAAALGGALSAEVARSDDPLAFPEGYRSWYHVKSLLLEEGHPLHASFGGLHHVYANEKALQGYRAGKFPDGSVIVFDLFEVTREGGAVAEGERKVLAIMVKDGQRFASTGGWGFEGFARGDPAQRVVGGNAKQACFDCHASQADHDYVFSRLRP